eukprot:1153969-Pelagomonas_calceolata.AAC.1
MNCLHALIVAFPVHVHSAHAPHSCALMHRCSCTVLKPTNHSHALIATFPVHVHSAHAPHSFASVHRCSYTVLKPMN